MISSPITSRSNNLSRMLLLSIIYTRCSRIKLTCMIRFCFRNNANVAVPPTVSAVSRKEPHENIARIAKRYLDDNMQQAWINPRLISMVSEYKCNDYARRLCSRASIRTHHLRSQKQASSWEDTCASRIDRRINSRTWASRKIYN